MNKLKIVIFNSEKSSYYWIFADFEYVYLCNLSKSRLYIFFSTLGPFFIIFTNLISREPATVGVEDTRPYATFCRNRWRNQIKNPYPQLGFQLVLGNGSCWQLHEKCIHFRIGTQKILVRWPLEATQAENF